MTSEQNQETTTVNRLPFFYWIATILSFGASLLIPLALMDLGTYFKSFIIPIPSGDPSLILVYYFLVLVGVVSVALNVLVMLNYLFKNANFSFKIIFVFSNAITVVYMPLLNFFMIWIGLWSSGGSGILFILALIGVYQVKMSSYFT